MSKRLIYIAFGLVVLLAVACLSLPAKTAGQVKLAVGGLFLPLFGLANTSHQWMTKAEDALIPRRVLLTQLDQLRHENQLLQFQLQQNAEVLEENSRLRDGVGWTKQTPWKDKLKLARVVGRDPANWWRSIQIGLGSRDGIRPNLTVLTPQGLVGRTTEVSYSRTAVVLVGDPNCQVAARVHDSHETTGIIVPSSADAMDNTLVNLTYLPRTAPIKPGQKVFTSGQGGIYPPGIPLGQIVDSRLAEFGIYLEARVRLAENLNRLEEVWVLCP